MIQDSFQKKANVAMIPLNSGYEREQPDLFLFRRHPTNLLILLQ